MTHPNFGFQFLDLLPSSDFLLHIIWAIDDPDHVPASSTPKCVPPRTSEIKNTPFSDHNLQSVCLLVQVLSLQKSTTSHGNPEMPFSVFLSLLRLHSPLHSSSPHWYSNKWILLKKIIEPFKLVQWVLALWNISLPSISYPYNSKIVPFKYADRQDSVDSHTTGCMSSCLWLLVPSSTLVIIINLDNGWPFQVANGNPPSLTATPKFFPETPAPPKQPLYVFTARCGI